MPDTLQAIARSLSNDVQALAVVSQNVANLNTPGYRGVRAIPDFSQRTGLDNMVDKHGGEHRTAIDQRDGGLNQTMRPLDLALQGGPGFFVIERDGHMMLTRAGAFHIDAEGFLATPRGDRVQGLSGPIPVPAGAVRVAANGEVWSDQTPLGVLQLVAVADNGALRPAGEGAYLYEGAVAEWNGRVVQGALERANVDPAQETVNLMETTRHAESVQRAISIYDKAMDVGINQLGNN